MNEPARAAAAVALFGGTFDPIHYGHLRIAQRLCQEGRVGEVIFLPAARPPHKLGRPLAAGDHRLAMMRLALAEDPRLQVSDYELRQPGVSYTIHSARHFQEQYRERLRLIIGTDALRDLHLWYQARTLAAEFTFIVYPRPECPAPNTAELAAQFGAAVGARLGAAVLTGEEYAISSTRIRELLAAGADPAGLLPAPVLAYIHEHGLYRDR